MPDKLPHIAESALGLLFHYTCGLCRKRAEKDSAYLETQLKSVTNSDVTQFEGKVAPVKIEGVSHLVLALVKNTDSLTFHFCGDDCLATFRQAHAI